MPAKPKPKPKPATLVATTGVDYLGSDGAHHRLEAGESVKVSAVNLQALEWMTDAGFLAPPPTEDD